MNAVSSIFKLRQQTNQSRVSIKENDSFSLEDYDDVDRVLINRPHFIRDREVLVTKFIPSEQQREGPTTRSNRPRFSNFDESREEKTDLIRVSRTRKLNSSNSYGIVSFFLRGSIFLH